MEQKKTQDETATRSDTEDWVFCGLWVHHHNTCKPNEKQQRTSADQFLMQRAFGIHDL